MSYGFKGNYMGNGLHMKELTDVQIRKRGGKRSTDVEEKPCSRV